MWWFSWANTLPRKISTILVLWYAASLVVLWLNKYILVNVGVDANALAVVQALACVVFGKLSDMVTGVDSYRQDKKSSAKDASESKSLLSNAIKIWTEKSMIELRMLGFMRLANVYMGLTALIYVSVSFTGTFSFLTRQAS